MLGDNPSRIDYKFLERFESFRQFRIAHRHKTESATNLGNVDSGATPEETIEAAYGDLRQQLSADLLEKIKQTSPYFFEMVVLRLLQAMGYGGVSGSGMLTRASRDGGIDGVIYEDKLGLDSVCIQAKRWENTVGRQTVQQFVGSMDMHRSKKGVILTTSKFTADAFSFVDRIEGKKVVLVEGDKLCQLQHHRQNCSGQRRKQQDR